jgi:hypothetical protein
LSREPRNRDAIPAPLHPGPTVQPD